MCLVADTPEIKTAEKDITVYKVLNGFNTSPYRYMGYKVGENYPCESDDDSANYCEYAGYATGSINRPVKRWEYNGGWLHAYALFSDAVTCADNCTGCNVVECKIPKGTRYVKSRDGHELCAKCLKFDTMTPVYKGVKRIKLEHFPFNKFI